MEVDGKIESARIAIGAVGVVWWGITLNEWVAILTGLYMLLQILILLPKICRSVHGWLKQFRDA